MFWVNQVRWRRELMAHPLVCAPCGLRLAYTNTFCMGLHRTRAEIPSSAAFTHWNNCREQWSIREQQEVIPSPVHCSDPQVSITQLHQRAAKLFCWHLEYSSMMSYWYFLEYYTTAWQGNPSQEWKQIISREHTEFLHSVPSLVKPTCQSHCVAACSLNCHL